MQPFPSVGQAYAHVRREALRQAVMTAGDSDPVTNAVLASKSLTLGPANSTKSSGSRKNSVASKSRTYNTMQCSQTSGMSFRLGKNETLPMKAQARQLWWMLSLTYP